MVNQNLPRRKDRIYKIYNCAKHRCRTSGLSMYQEWQDDFELFKIWSILNNYQPNHRLYLRKVNDGFFPSNCVWAEKARDVRFLVGKRKHVCTECKLNLTAMKGSMCRPCFAKKRRTSGFSRQEYARNWTLNKKYGIGLDDFNLLFNQQNGRCLICKKNMKLPRKAQGQDMDTVAVDHNHNTNEIRGLLCNACNKGLGHFQDSAAVLRSAINYLITKDGLNEKTSFDSQGFANITNKWR
jgi:hypothetical protein